MKNIEHMCDNFKTCIKLKRNLERPMVGLPMGRVFNEVIALDIDELEGNKFLVMVDLATH